MVTGANGPEAGVWVIAETNALPTTIRQDRRHRRQGRYVLPELPKANYDIWVRGYGLVDSPKSKSEPGRTLNLKAVAAPNARLRRNITRHNTGIRCSRCPRAAISPAPAERQRHAREAEEPGPVARQLKTDGCFSCHQLGNKPTRTIPKALGQFDILVRGLGRIASRSGQASENMVRDHRPARHPARIQDVRRLDRPDRRRRTAEGEAAASARASSAMSSSRCGTGATPRPTCTTRSPPTSAIRPSTPTARSTARPRISTDNLPILDPVTQHGDDDQDRRCAIRRRRAPRTMPVMQRRRPIGATRRSGTARPRCTIRCSIEKGRVWFTARIRRPQTPAFCRKGSDHPSAKLFPIERAGAPVAMYDPKTQKFTLIDTCFTTHHLNFAEDANNTLWTQRRRRRRAGVVGWLNTKKFDETGDEQKSQGWTPFMLDTNGNGKRDDYVEPNQPVDPAKDKRIVAGLYGIGYDPADGIDLGHRCSAFPAASCASIPGDNPPETTLTEYYEVPSTSRRRRSTAIRRAAWTSTATASCGCRSRAATWRASTAASAKVRSTARPRPASIARKAGRSIRSRARSSRTSPRPGSAEVELLHLGRSVRHVRARQERADRHRQRRRWLLALVDGKFVTLRVPYPMGFYAKGMDGRIDDPNGGWKGKGLWTTYGTRTPVPSSKAARARQPRW